MSQRKSGYKRKKNDLYETPEWVTQALLPYLPLRIKHIWEPAAGSGKIEDELVRAGFFVFASDLINTGIDFLQWGNDFDCDAIITNPPFGLAQEFIEHALGIMVPNKGLVAMLLRADYDSAKTRSHLFRDCPQFSRKVVLTRRIVWFPKKGAAPSFNHSWYIWDHQHKGPPILSYQLDPA